MTGVRSIRVASDEADLRLDRWFRRHYPGLSHGRLEKLLRTGQVRVDGTRIKAGHRLKAGQRVRVPPLGPAPPRPAKPSPTPVSAADAKRLRASVLYRDADIIAIDKPPGLAVQGGSKTRRHLDAMLDALTEPGGERPRLVHRLDRDTSGVLVLARGAAAAARLAAAFRGRTLRKLYWALVVGRPREHEGRIALPLAKRAGVRGERATGDAGGKPAVTLYEVIDSVGDRAAWLALAPLTGRTHQLRAHCAALGTPIVGDGKYGGAGAFLSGEGIARALHLHARAIELPGADGAIVRIVAPLPPHMRETWRVLGFDPDRDGEPFADEGEQGAR
ncbi:MAG: RluA family pseudouridine synthase [Alphaproteobacteria bacterium]